MGDVDAEKALGRVELPETGAELEGLVRDPQTEGWVTDGLSARRTRTLSTGARTATRTLAATGTAATLGASLGRSTGVVGIIVFAHVGLHDWLWQTEDVGVVQQIAQVGVTAVRKHLPKLVHRTTANLLKTLLGRTTLLLVVLLTPDVLEPTIDDRVKVDNRVAIDELGPLGIQLNAGGLDDAFEVSAAQGLERFGELVPARHPHLSHEVHPADAGQVLHLADGDDTRALAVTLTRSEELEHHLAGGACGVDGVNPKGLTGECLGLDIPRLDLAVEVTNDDSTADAALEHGCTELGSDDRLEVVHVDAGESAVVDQLAHDHHRPPPLGEVSDLDSEWLWDGRQHADRLGGDSDLSPHLADASLLERPLHWRVVSARLADELVALALAERADQATTETTELVPVLDRTTD